jgi:membrane protein YdbS with pleckstrin-like domain
MGVSLLQSLLWSRAPKTGEHADRLVAELRRHEVGLLGLAVRTVVTAAFFGAIWATLDTWQPGGELASAVLGWMVVGLFGFYLVFGLSRRFLGWANARTIITDQRVVVRYRLRKPGWEIPLLSISDVTYSRGPLTRFFGVGALHIQTTFAPQPAVVADVAHVSSVRNELLKLRNEAWSQHAAQMAGQYPPMQEAS